MKFMIFWVRSLINIQLSWKWKCDRCMISVLAMSHSSNKQTGTWTGGSWFTSWCCIKCTGYLVISDMRIITPCRFEIIGEETVMGYFNVPSIPAFACRVWLGHLYLTHFLFSYLQCFSVTMVICICMAHECWGLCLHAIALKHNAFQIFSLQKDITTTPIDYTVHNWNQYVISYGFNQILHSMLIPVCYRNVSCKLFF